MAFTLKRGMAAGKDHLKPLVRDRFRHRIVQGAVFQFQQIGDFVFFACKVLGAAQFIQRLAPRNSDQPRAWGPWQTILTPMIQRRDHRLLQAILCQLQIIQAADQ